MQTWKNTKPKICTLASLKLLQVMKVLNKTILSLLLFLDHHLHGCLNSRCLAEKGQCRDVLRTASVNLYRKDITGLCNPVCIIQDTCHRCLEQTNGIKLSLRQLLSALRTHLAVEHLQ